jgi:hypothetical protein
MRVGWFGLLSLSPPPPGRVARTGNVEATRIAALKSSSRAKHPFDSNNFPPQWGEKKPASMPRPEMKRRQ